MILSEGSIFGLISGCLTAIGLVLSNVSAKSNINLIIMILISLAVSDGLSDAFGIYFSTYKDDKNYTVSLKEASKAFLGKVSIPLIMALIFFITKNVNLASRIILCLVLIIFLLVDYYVFIDMNIIIRSANILVFILIVIINYYIGSKF